MMSVGPPAGNPTTTRTGRFGYPCADDGATPVSSNRLARIPYRTGIVALSLNNFLGAIIGEGGFPNKGKTPPGRCGPATGCQSSGSILTIEAPSLLPTQKLTGVVRSSTKTR